MRIQKHQDATWIAAGRLCPNLRIKDSGKSTSHNEIKSSHKHQIAKQNQTRFKESIRTSPGGLPDRRSFRSKRLAKQRAAPGDRPTGHRPWTRPRPPGQRLGKAPAGSAVGFGTVVVERLVLGASSATRRRAMRSASGSRMTTDSSRRGQGLDRIPPRRPVERPRPVPPQVRVAQVSTPVAARRSGDRTARGARQSLAAGDHCSRDYVVHGRPAQRNFLPFPASVESAVLKLFNPRSSFRNRDEQSQHPCAGPAQPQAGGASTQEGEDTPRHGNGQCQPARSATTLSVKTVSHA